MPCTHRESIESIDRERESEADQTNRMDVYKTKIILDSFVRQFKRFASTDDATFCVQIYVLESEFTTVKPSARNIEYFSRLRNERMCKRDVSF